jgi:hypothetical protein
MEMSQRNLSPVLAKVVSYLSPTIVLLVFALFAILVRFEASVTAMSTIGVPIILASLIVIWKARVLKRGLIPTFTGFYLSSRALLYLFLLFVIAYLCSLCFLFQNGPRPIAYFCLVAVMAGLIFIEILGIWQKNGNWQGIILCQIVLISLNLIFSQTLRLPLYFGGGDVLDHMSYIRTIVESGHTTSAMEGYQFFPLFHIFGTSSILITGMQLKFSYFVLNGLSFVISLPIVYLFARQVTKNGRLALLATLLYCLCREVIFNGMYMNTREMAFVFCLLVLYLLLQENRWLKIAAVGLILPLVLMHQTTLLHFSVIMIIIIVVEFVILRRVQYIHPNYVTLFTIAYVGYWLWLCYPFLSGWLITASASETVEIPTVTTAFREPLFATVAKAVDYSIIYFFAIIGIVSQLYQDDQRATIGHVFAFFSFIVMPFFIPEIADILSPLFLAYRMVLLLTPFIATAMAAGILALIAQLDTNRHRFKSTALFTLIISLFIIYSFSSPFLMGTTTDLNLSQLGYMDPRRYFTQAEMESFAFMAQYKSDVPVYTDSHSGRGLEFFRTQAEKSADVFDPEAIGESYMLFRKETFEIRGILLFEPPEKTAIYFKSYEYRTGMTPNLETVWQEENRVFNNNAVHIYLR